MHTHRIAGEARAASGCAEVTGQSETGSHVRLVPLPLAAACARPFPLRAASINPPAPRLLSKLRLLLAALALDLFVLFILGGVGLRPLTSLVPLRGEREHKSDAHFWSEEGEMGRQPCCEKVGLKKGPWTAEEDQKLVAFLLSHGHCCWRLVPKLAGEVLA